MGRDLQAQRLETRHRQRALLRLETDSPRCFICGENRPEALERHHVAGRRFADETVILCANCHRCNSDPSADQRQKDGDLSEAKFMEGLAELLNERARYVRDRSTGGTCETVAKC